MVRGPPGAAAQGAVRLKYVVMAPYALSTMWWQGRFPNLGEFARAARRLGFPNVEISYVVGPEGVEELLASHEVGITSVHNPVPRVFIDGRSSEQFNLAATDEDERRLAVELGRRTLEVAARAGARAVVVHMGHLPQGLAPERELRRLYDQGLREGEEVEALRSMCRRLRAEAVPPHLEQARRSLEELAEKATSLGVAIALENRFHYHEIPTVDEAQQLLSPYPPHLVGYWHDVGHAEVLDRLGLVPKERWLKELGGRCLGSHLHDVVGLTDHRAPGQGTADWDYISRYLPAHALRVLEINQEVPEEQVAGALDFLRQRGLL
jgi:sugar phosphate isomerase/epimerase